MKTLVELIWNYPKVFSMPSSMATYNYMDAHNKMLVKFRMSTPDSPAISTQSWMYRRTGFNCENLLIANCVFFQSLQLINETYTY